MIFNKIIIFLMILIKFGNFSKSPFRFRNDTTTKTRQKRGLIFEGGGVNKMLFGTIYPLYLEDPIKWRQMNCAYNLQAQYAVPTSPLYPWDKWEGRSLQSAREEFDRTGHFVPDESRKFVYVALETYMNSRGKNGRKCLLRAICENVQIDDHHGIFSEILHTILTPGKEDLHAEYHDAYQAGKNGILCLKLYPECPLGDSFVDAISHIT